MPILADWSKPNPAIEQLIFEYGRAGIPYYLAIPGGEGEEDGSRPAVELPEILTGSGPVIEALEKVASR